MSFLSAVAAAASLCAACQGDITGGPAPTRDGSTPAVNAPPDQTPAGGTDVPESGDWFASVQGADCTKPQAPSRTRIRRLSTAQWKNTVSQALAATPAVDGFPQDTISSTTGFNTDATINKVNVQLANAYYDAGDSLAPNAAAAALTAYPCLATMAKDATCSTPFIKDYGSKLFRRPLTDLETTRYTGFLSAQAALDTAAVAVGSVIRAFLLSPNTVYITELGSSTPGDVKLTPYEQASLISYTVADAPPDQALLQAATKGSLDNQSERLAQAQRLLQTPGARTKYADFWQQYLPLGDLRKATDLDPTLAGQITDEASTHFDKIVWQDNGSFADLLTAPYTYGAAGLSAVYGTLTPNAKGGLDLPPGQRSGFITQTAFLFMESDATVEHKVIHRGLTVRRRLLCQSPPPPPANLKPVVADLRVAPEGSTPLESFTAFAAAKPMCAACHVTFQPIGLGFEEYDNMGKYRTAYADGKPIDTSGNLSDAGDAAGPYANAVEIAQHIGQSKIGEYCFSKQFAEYSLGRHLNSTSDACEIRGPSDASAPAPIQKISVVLSDIEAGSHRVHN